MENIYKIRQLDQFDEKILDILQNRGRIPVTELAGLVGLSKTPCQVRMKRLQEDGYILGYRAVLNPAKLELYHVVFVEIKLTNTTESALQEFNRAVVQIPEIEMCHLIAGVFDYILKVRTKDIQSYRRVLAELISQLPHVSTSATHVSMEPVKDTAF